MAVHDDVYIDVTADRRCRLLLCGVASPPLSAVAVWSRLSAAVRLATAQQVLQKIQDYLQIQSLEFKINCVYLLKVKHRNRID